MHLVRRAAQQAGAGMSLSDFDRTLDMLYSGQPSYTGKLVSQSTAMAISTFWACVNIVSSDFATLPAPTIRTVGESRVEAPEHYLWGLLQDQANPEMSAFRFKQTMQAWIMLWGNAYAELQINGRGQITAMWPWRPDRVQVFREYDGGPLVYSYRMRNDRPVFVPADRMFHLRGLGIDGVTGLNPVETHRQTLGMAGALVEHGARFFSNGARPLGIIRVTEALSDKAYERLKKDWHENHGGLENAHRVAILEEGAEWSKAGETMVDAQYIESQKLTAEDIARICNVPHHRVGLMADSTNSNITQQSLEYVLYTQMPICANWRSEIHCSMLSARELQTISTVFKFINLLRGDYEAMGKFIAVVRQWGILSADEVREQFLDLSPIKDGSGKAYWEPVNMVPSVGGQDNRDIAPNMKKVAPKDSAPGGKTNGFAHYPVVA